MKKETKMLTYKDVMYGDIVSIEDYNIDKTTFELIKSDIPCKVVGYMDAGLILEYVNDEKELAYTAMDKVKPFDITKEFLEKNGFENTVGCAYEFEIDKQNKITIVMGDVDTPFVSCESLDGEIKLYGVYPLHIIQHICKELNIEKEFVL